MENIAYKFVKWDIPPLESLKNSRAYILAMKLNQGEDFSREEKDEITYMVRIEGVAKLRGWLFPIPELKTFYIEQYGSVYKRRGYDKTAIRKSIIGRINKITEKI